MYIPLLIVVAYLSVLLEQLQLEDMYIQYIKKNDFVSVIHYARTVLQLVFNAALRLKVSTSAVSQRT